MTTTTEPDLQRQLHDQEERLLREFADACNPTVVRRCFAEAVSRLADAPVKIYVPIFAYRDARERLGALTQREDVAATLL